MESSILLLKMKTSWPLLNKETSYQFILIGLSHFLYPQGAAPTLKGHKPALLPAKG